MSGPTAAPHVQRYGTRLLRTQIEAEGEAFRWIRTPGVDARQDFAPPVHLPDLLSQDGDGAVPLIGGHPVGPGRTYVVAGHQSAAGLLLEERFGAGFDRHLNGLGRALRRLHESAPSAEAGHLAAPRALSRLTGWLDGQGLALGAQVARTQLLPMLGATRWAKVCGWFETAWDEPVLCHGAPSLGSLTIDADGERPMLLTGEDLGWAPWEYDVGWVIGELVELGWQLALQPSTQAGFIGAVMSGYDRPISAGVRRWMILRVLLHMHDFSAYTDGGVQVLPYYSSFVNHLIDSQPEGRHDQ